MPEVRSIEKELDESNDDYKGMTAHKPHTDHSDKKRNPNFVTET